MVEGNKYEMVVKTLERSFDILLASHVLPEERKIGLESARNMLKWCKIEYGLE